MKKLVCNFKSNITPDKFENILENIISIRKDIELILCPPVTLIDYIPPKIKRGSQNISIYNDDFAVGEITGNILKDISTKYVIIGHSDRKNRYRETEIDFIKKIKIATSVDIIPIYCVGETREEKLRGKTLATLERQIARVFNQLDDPTKVVLAYEPRWAISNEHNGFDKVNVMEISEIIDFIKKLVLDYYGFNIEVLYGGSINATNIDQYRNLKSDGLLIGQACLDSNAILKIADKM